MKEAYFLTWTELEPDKGPIIKIIDSHYSETDEIEQLVKEWYSSKNQAVPEFEYEYIDAWRKKENEEKEYDRKIISGEVVLEATPIKPSFGTPEFWKAYWIKKKAKEAETASGNKDNDAKSVASNESKKKKAAKVMKKLEKDAEKNVESVEKVKSDKVKKIIKK